MAPVEIYLGEELITTTCTNQCEITVPKVPMKIYYSGDDCGSIIAIKHPDGERMTDFPLAAVGTEKLMRFEQTIELPVEKNRSGSVTLQKVLKFKRI
jgi:hypothetical protein